MSIYPHLPINITKNVDRYSRHGKIKLRQTGGMVLLTMPSTSVLVHKSQVKWSCSVRAVFQKKWGKIWGFGAGTIIFRLFSEIWRIPFSKIFVVACCCLFCLLLWVFGSPLFVFKCRCLWRDEPTKKGMETVLVRVCEVQVPEYTIYIWAIKYSIILQLNEHV